VIPAELGGYGKIFASVNPKMLLLSHGTPGNLGQTFSYASLAFGSALALFLYPHSMTGILSASSRRVVRRNAILLPAYSIALALIALLGYMAIAAGLKSMPEFATGFKTFGNNFAVPALFLRMFPAWFAGFAFAGIAVGALVPASIMAIACGNLFTRNIYKEFFAPNCTPRQESAMAKIASLLMKLGALFFVLELQTSYAIQLQLLGGIWICQTLPAVLIGLYTRYLHPWALLIGWAVGMVAGTAMAAELGLKSSVYPLQLFGLVIPCYAALVALVPNLALSFILTPVFNALSGAPHPDETVVADYS
jgi:solute:Na+ symporter, SSS family